jgi:hypothetical protein
MGFTKKNVTRSKYTRAKRVKRSKKTNKRRSRKCVKGGDDDDDEYAWTRMQIDEKLKKIVESINIRSRNVDYYIIMEKNGGSDINYKIQKFTSPTTKHSFFKGNKLNFNKLNFERGKEENIARNKILPSIDMLKFEEEEKKGTSEITNTVRRIRPGCILRKINDDLYEIDVSLTTKFIDYDEKIGG